MSQPFKLFRLQQIDSQLDQVNTRLREIEIALNNKASIHQAQAIVDDKVVKLEVARKSLRRSEENVQVQQVKIEQSETTLYSGKISNPKELQDLHNEGAALKRYLSVLEDRQLEAMIAMEEAEAQYAAASLTLKNVIEENTHQNKELTKEQEVLTQEVERLNAERQAAVNSINNDDLRLYEGLRQKRRGVAVAKVTDNTCSACGSTPTAALLQAAQSPNRISFCDTCGRILYRG